MARRRFTSSSRTFRPRKTRSWVASNVATGGTALAASTSALVEIVQPLVPDVTLLRMRGMFAWRSDNPGASENQLGSIGGIIVEEPAATVGITAIPTPSSDGDSDWHYHTYFASRLEFVSGVGFDPNMFHSIVVDSKAMRKMSDTQRSVIVIENSAPFGMEFWWQVRYLLQVPS